MLSVFRYFSRPTLSDVSGTYFFEKIGEKVEIIRDKWGVPHIFAKNETDLLFALGYVEAQDRLWQMEVVRRVATGTLSEMVGEERIEHLLWPAGTTWELDIVSRAIGFGYIGKVGEKMIGEDTRRRLDAFCSGINSFIELHRNKLPIEFRILGVQPDMWTPSDVIAVARFFMWGLSRNFVSEMLRYLFSLKFGEEKMWALMPYHKDSGPYIIPREVKDYSRNKKMFKNDYRLFLIPELREKAELLIEDYLKWTQFNGFFSIGSNNWVVSGERTMSGKPILANDPHLPHMMPSVFYIVHLNTPDMDVYGVLVPGTPFVMIGHNRFIAWGATVTMADTQDVYIEKLSADKERYIFKGEEKEFQVRDERICKRTAFGKRCSYFRFRTSIHGPVISDIIPSFKAENYVLSVTWTGFGLTEEDVAFLMLARAKNIDEFREALSRMGTGIQNWVYADVNGNIGYSVSGLVPYRRNWDGTLPVPGWTGEYEWNGFIPYDELPQVFNPDRGYIITANNQVVPPEDYPYAFSFEYLPSSRAMRIEQLILEKKKLTVQDMRNIQMDLLDPYAGELNAIFIKTFDEVNPEDRRLRKMMDYLRGWDFRYTSESIPAAIFEEIMRQTIQGTLLDELGKRWFEFYAQNIPSISYYHMFLKDDGFPFYDDIRTPQRETRSDIILRGIRDAESYLTQKLGWDMSEWKWGRIHTLTFRHPLGVVYPLDKLFNIGPFPHSGSRETVNNAFFFYGDDENLYNTEAGPVMRFIIDMSDPLHARMVIDTGESGLPLNEHYRDLNELWMRGEFIITLMERKEIEDNMSHYMVLKPY